MLRQTKTQEIEKLKKQVSKLNWNFMLIMFVFITMAGGLANMNEVVINGGKMPVYSADNFTYSDSHFSFQDKSQVNHFFYSDRFLILGDYFSIGDFLIIAGTIGMLSMVVIPICFFVKRKIRERKIREKKIRKARSHHSYSRRSHKKRKIYK